VAVDLRLDGHDLLLGVLGGGRLASPYPMRWPPWPEAEACRRRPASRFRAPNQEARTWEDAEEARELT